jgi:hypothetical protein
MRETLSEGCRGTLLSGKCTYLLASHTTAYECALGRHRAAQEYCLGFYTEPLRNIALDSTQNRSGIFSWILYITAQEYFLGLYTEPLRNISLDSTQNRSEIFPWILYITAEEYCLGFYT